jgi:hypothetical protein
MGDLHKKGGHKSAFLSKYTLIYLSFCFREFPILRINLYNGGPIRTLTTTTNIKNSPHPIAITGLHARALKINTGETTLNLFFIRSLQHRHFDAVTFRRIDGNFIPRISVSDHSHAWVCRQDSFQPARRFFRPVCHDDLPRML